ncbi:MAG TPA: cytochrome ubiquinol oxidase subunit I [Rubrivivax sp.]|nr:cytochrome ubiquinol oxidase subunit I [Rubrivivax sp.]
MKVFAVSFGMGVVTGIVMAFQFGTHSAREADRDPCRRRRRAPPRRCVLSLRRPRTGSARGATAMTELVVQLPDDLARRARSAGLLTDGAIQRLLEEAMRREAGRRLMQVTERLHAAGVPPMSEQEIDAEVKAVRAERRTREAQSPKHEPS